MQSFCSECKCRYMLHQEFLAKISTIMEAILQYKLINFLVQGGKDPHRLKYTTHIFLFTSTPHPQNSKGLTPPSFLSSSAVMVISFHYFFIFISFLSLQITARCVFICFIPLHLSLTIALLYLFFISSSSCLLLLSTIIIIITSLEHPDQI